MFPPSAHVAFCGKLFELKFTLPFTDFLPETVLLNFAILVCDPICYASMYFSMLWHISLCIGLPLYLFISQSNLRCIQSSDLISSHLVMSIYSFFYETFHLEIISIKQGEMEVYVHSKLVVKCCYEKCELVAINISAVNTVNVVTYRPPKTKSLFSVSYAEYRLFVLICKHCSCFLGAIFILFYDVE